jgi:hypothetical protein
MEPVLQLPSQIENADQTLQVSLPEVMVVDVDGVCCWVFGCIFFINNDIVSDALADYFCGSRPCQFVIL